MRPSQRSRARVLFIIKMRALLPLGLTRDGDVCFYCDEYFDFQLVVRLELC